MFVNERQKVILERLKSNKTVMVSELATLFDVSIETVRRDIISLEKTGLIKRIHGGATISKNLTILPPLGERIGANCEMKRRAAIAACELVREGDVISIESGSTAMAVVEVLKDNFKDLTILTNSSDVLNELERSTNFRLISTGGVYHRSERAFYGPAAEDTILRTNVKYSFLFPSAVTSDGVSISIYDLLGVERAFMKNAQQTIFVFDSTQTISNSVYKLSEISTDHIYVTDDEMSDAACDRFEDATGVRIIRYRK